MRHRLDPISLPQEEMMEKGSSFPKEEHPPVSQHKESVQTIMPSMLGCQRAPPVFIFRGSISQAPFYMATVSMCLLISEDQEPHSALNYSSGNFMFKSEASLFKNKSPCIVKDDSPCSRAGHSFMFLDLGFLTEIQKEAVRTANLGMEKVG